MTTPPQPAAPARSFARDVFINVLANLIAAAIIYLLAVLGGYLKSNPIVVSVALTIVGGASVAAIVLGGVWYTTSGDDPRHAMRAKRLIAGTTGVLLAAIALAAIFAPGKR